MSIITSQQIKHFYNSFKDVDVTFNKEVIFATGLDPREVYIKSGVFRLPCVIYSTSMTGAKVIANLTSEKFSALKDKKTSLSLRFSFHSEDKGNPLNFYITSRLKGFRSYDENKPDLYFLSLEFIQKPASELIEKLGVLLEATHNSTQRTEERILISRDTIQIMGLSGKTANLFFDNVWKKCIVRDLSFSGSKILLAENGAAHVNKPSVLRLFTNNGTGIDIHGRIIRNESVEGHEDISALAISFDSKKTPVEYKLRINEYLKSKKSN